MHLFVLNFIFHDLYLQFLWLFKEQRLTVPHWRNQRPYLMSQKVLKYVLFYSFMDFDHYFPFTL